jgi:geranylgeranyl pyrophosphate synthase
VSSPGVGAAGLGFPIVDAALESRMRERLGEIERALLAAVDSETPFVRAAARHLLEAGGKRFRPLLVLLAAEFGDPAAPGIVPASLVVELTHVATLYHDDVMDEAALRRGAPSANARWDNSVAILTGDYLFAQASAIVADLGPTAVRIQAETFSRLVQGQIRETIGPSNGDELAHYLSVVTDKTASLIATAARFGAMMAGADPDQERVLTDFGEQIGTLFQLSDDLLDIASDATESGKTPGTDLREGVRTLPVLLARLSTDPSDSRLLSLLEGDLTDDATHRETLELLRSHRAMEEARARISRGADCARSLLDSLPDISARDVLAGLCDVVVTRSS